jgi:putative transposase
VIFLESFGEKVKAVGGHALPVADHGWRRNPVEARVYLDAVEGPGVDLEVVLGVGARWIEGPDPVLVGPAAAAYPHILRFRQADLDCALRLIRVVDGKTKPGSLNRKCAFSYMTLARKSVKQGFNPSVRLLSLMEHFRQMTNDCIRIGLQFEADNKQTPSMKKLSLLSYLELRKRYGGYSQYALCAISKAAGILSARKKSVRRGFPTKTPYISRPMLVSCYGFKVDGSSLIIHLDGETFEWIPLNAHTRWLLSDPELRVCSFTLTEEAVSLCVSKEVKEIRMEEVTGTLGVDRNLRNLAVGDGGQLVTFYDMAEPIRVGESTVDVVSSFTRNDVRIRRRIASKYGRRRSDRTGQLLNLVSKRVVGEAKARKLAIVFENITGIRKLYRKGGWSQ